MWFFASGFFHESVSPQPQSIPLGPFQIFSKIRGDIRKSRCTTGINDTGGKFATGVNDTGTKIAACIIGTGRKSIPKSSGRIPIPWLEVGQFLVPDWKTKPAMAMVVVPVRQAT